jgi:uncharacterized protein (DUF983 family)
MSTLVQLCRSPAGQVGRSRINSAQAVFRGVRGKCPNCGRGRLFSGFLKVVDRCEVCGEELFHQRADDFPPYIVIVLVGHTVIPLALTVEMEYAPPMWLQVAIWMPATIGLALCLIQPVKGAIVAVQWYGQMHGFGQPREQEAAPD